MMRERVGKMKNRRKFLTGFASMLGLGALGSTKVLAGATEPQAINVEFRTHLPRPMTLKEYKLAKEGFENPDLVQKLLISFKRMGKIKSESYAFHGTHSSWTLSFASKGHYREWMTMTDELRSHMSEEREKEGYRLEIREV